MDFCHWAVPHIIGLVRFVEEFVGELLNALATCNNCISGTDLLKPLYGLPHRGRWCRYNSLSHPVTADWKATHFLVEVGCRGFIATNITKWMRVAGLGPKKKEHHNKSSSEDYRESKSLDKERWHQLEWVLMVDSKRHTVGLARRPHIGEGARCVIKGAERKSPKQRCILSWWSQLQSLVRGAFTCKQRRKLFWTIHTWPVCPSADHRTPGAWQGSHWSTNS